MALRLLKDRAAQLSATPSGVIKQRGGNLVMKQLKRILTVFLMAVVLSLSALSQVMVFGQKGNSNRPPKEPEKIKEQPKPPPGNNNGGGNSNRRKP